MRDEKRIRKITDLIRELWTITPDQRFFQFLINNSTLVDYRQSDPWYYEDDELLKSLEFHIKQLKKPKKTKETCNKVGKK